MQIDQHGVLHEARFVASPNCDPRPAGTHIELLVIHGISLPPGEFGGAGVESLFTNSLDHGAHPYYEQLRGMEVSSHFFLRRTGEIVQFVPCELRAWHAGASCWQGRERCNDFSIGVELEGTDEIPYTEAQYVQLIALTRALCARYPLREILGHSDIAPGRKTDPGAAFDWLRYRAALRD
jgi:AmpD protein